MSGQDIWRSREFRQNTEGTGDVVFKVAKNGYYLYVYLVFSNGGIACYQYDCIDM